MTTGDLIVIAVLGLMIGSIIGAMVKDKKNGKTGCGGCSGCPNYGNCRAHLGCSNNPNTRK